MSRYWKTIAFYVAVGMLLPLLMCLFGNLFGWRSEVGLYDWKSLPSRLATCGTVFVVIGWALAEREKRLNWA